MRIHSVRRGFATNSSSMHSLAIVTGKTPEDYLVDSGEFGWANFTAASVETKKRYLACLLRHNMEADVSDDVIDLAIEKEFGLEAQELHEDSIDHQSILHLPSDWFGRSVDLRFFRALCAFVMGPEVVVLGGNDNSTRREQHPLLKHRIVLPIPKKGRYSELICRFDPLGYWVLFDRATGTKIRMSFASEQTKVGKASFPELVDVKITEFCPYGCPMCYQSSDSKGAHASSDSLWSLKTALAPSRYRASNRGVLRPFEVAIGGGEPTLHPDFMPFLYWLSENGVVPSFSTRNVDWLGDWKIAGRISEVVGGVAISTQTRTVLGDVADAARRSNFPLPKLSVQYVVGLRQIGELGAIMDWCAQNGVVLTLLDLKRTGRAKSTKRLPEDWIADWTANREMRRSLRLGIDTALAAREQQRLEELGVAGWSYETLEGKFSCYVDAVRHRIGPSSYCPEKDLVDVKDFDREASLRAAIEKEWPKW